MSRVLNGDACRSLPGNCNHVNLCFRRRARARFSVRTCEFVCRQGGAPAAAPELQKGTRVNANGPRGVALVRRGAAAGYAPAKLAFPSPQSSIVCTR
eukprot:3580331-Prymnesium_polylepis.1